MEHKELTAQSSAGSEQNESFQQRVQPWMMACFGPMIASDREERNHRFLEEALELVQSTGCTASEAHQLVDYVYGRPIGETAQEVGGVMVTLAALCLANTMDMNQCGETELERIWTKVEAIRAKQAAKPKYSPLPSVVECIWSIDPQIESSWESACGELWSFIEGGPKENGVSYCQHCGKQVRLVESDRMQNEAR